MSQGEQPEPQEEDHGVDQEGLLPADGVTEDPGEEGRHEVSQDPAAGWRYKYYDQPRVTSNVTYPAALLLSDVEIIEEQERSEVWLGLETAGVGCVGTVVVMSVVTVVTVVVMLRVLELVEDDAGGGDTRPLQQTHAVDDGGAEHLPEQRSSLQFGLPTVFLHLVGVIEVLAGTSTPSTPLCNGLTYETVELLHTRTSQESGRVSSLIHCRDSSILALLAPCLSSSTVSVSLVNFLFSNTFSLVMSFSASKLSKAVSSF